MFLWIGALASLAACSPSGGSAAPPPAIPPREPRLGAIGEVLPGCTPYVSRVQRVGDDFIASADYDGDGSADVSIVRPNGRWLIDYSGELGFGAYERTLFEQDWGTYEWLEEKNGTFLLPLPAYYDLDCRVDRGAVNIFGSWFVDYAADGLGNWVRYETVAKQCPLQGGNRPAAIAARRSCLNNFTYVPADYDGDGMADLSVKTRSGDWHIDYAANGFGDWDTTYSGFGSALFGPVPADYDGDGKADFSTRDSDRWYVDWSANGRGEEKWDAIYPGFGSPANFVPVPADYDGDRKADFASRDGDRWYIDWSNNGRGEENWDAIYPGFASPRNYAPAPADYDGDRHVDLASHTSDGLWLIDYARDGFGDWNQAWNSFLLVSGGFPTTDDLRQFDLRWMSPRMKAATYDAMCGAVRNSFIPILWGVGETMASLARMYEVTKEIRYLEELKRYVTCLLQNRDDRRRSVAIAPLCDAVRGKCRLPAWGSSGMASAGKYVVNETASNMYAYSIARFARIVFEDARLHEAYGPYAIDAVNAALETALLFLPEFDTRPDRQFAQGFLALPISHAWTDADCQAEFDRERKEIERTRPVSPDELSDMGVWLGMCTGWNDPANSHKPYAYNLNGGYGLTLLEVNRAIESQYYRRSGREAQSAALARGLFPLMIARIQRYFHSALIPDGRGFKWHYSEERQAEGKCCEDWSHAAFTMRFVVVLYDNLTLLAPRTPEPILLDPNTMRRFANTFLRMVRSGNIADGVGGSSGKEENNVACYSWLDFALFYRSVYDRCREMLLRRNNGLQPSLNQSTHAALLANAGQRGTPPPPR
jgi:hypothetical protein